MYNRLKILTLIKKILLIKIFIILGIKSYNYNIKNDIIDILKNIDIYNKTNKENIILIKKKLKTSRKNQEISIDEYLLYRYIIRYVNNKEEDINIFYINLIIKSLNIDLNIPFIEIALDNIKEIDIEKISKTDLIIIADLLEIIVGKDDIKLFDKIFSKISNIEYLIKNTFLLINLIIYDKRKYIQYLLDKKVNLNEPICSKNIPIILAASFHKKEIVKMLIKNYVSLNQVEDEYFTALTKLIISINPNIDIIKILLKHNIDINYVDIFFSIFNSIQESDENRGLIAKLILKNIILNKYIKDYHSNNNDLYQSTIYCIISSLLKNIYYLIKINIKYITNNYNHDDLYNCFVEYQDSLNNNNKNEIFNFINNNKEYKSILHERLINQIQLYNLSKIVAKNLTTGYIDIDKLDYNEKKSIEITANNLNLKINSNYIKIKPLLILYINKYKTMNYKIKYKNQEKRYKKSIENKLIQSIIEQLNSFNEIVLLFILFKGN